MGSDQSTQQGRSKSKSKNPKRSQSNDGGGHKLASSPRPSICSDSDIPYVSYTSKPISDDSTSDRRVKWNDFRPRIREKNVSREKRDKKSKSVGSLVVVNPAAEIPTFDKDPLYQRLTEIPPFVPIIRGSMKIPWTKDPDIAEKVEPSPLIRIGLFYEDRLTKHAQSVLLKQDTINKQITQLDEEIIQIMKTYNERQKKLTRVAEKLSKVIDLSNSLTKCHTTLNQALESIEILNNLLPTEERLEPFVWTTG